MATLCFRTMEQAVLFKHELAGQISDGHWENFQDELMDILRPWKNSDFDPYEDEYPDDVMDHWKPWCDAAVGWGDPVGRDFDVVYDGYDFADSFLLSCVGDRMVKYVRIARRYGFDRVEELSELLDLHGKFRIPEHEGRYWDEVRELATKTDTEEFKRVIEDESLYSWKDMVLDLDDMKKIVRTKRGD